MARAANNKNIQAKLVGTFSLCQGFFLFFFFGKDPVLVRYHLVNGIHPGKISSLIDLNRLNGGSLIGPDVLPFLNGWKRFGKFVCIWLVQIHRGIHRSLSVQVDTTFQMVSDKHRILLLLIINYMFLLLLLFSYHDNSNYGEGNYACGRTFWQIQKRKK